MRVDTRFPWGDPWARPDYRVSRVEATLGGVRWVGRPHQGPCFLLQRLDGWWGGGAVSGGVTPFDQADSGLHGDTYLHGRVVTLRGKILTDNGAQQMDAFDELTSVFASSRRVNLTVDEPERKLARMLTVTPTALPEPQPLSDRVADVSVTVESDTYPLLGVSAETVTLTTGGTPLRNNGNYPAGLSFALNGPLTNPGFTWSGGAWSYGGSIASGKRLFVDAVRRTVRDPDTTAHSRAKLLGLGAGSWPQLVPGMTTFWRTGSGSGNITASWRPSWA